MIYDYGFRDVDTKRIAPQTRARSLARFSEARLYSVVPVIPLKQIILLSFGRDRFVPSKGEERSWLRRGMFAEWTRTNRLEFSNREQFLGNE